jgi:hypothetical protein
MNEIINPTRELGMLRQTLQFMASNNADISQTAGDCFSSKVIKRTRLKSRNQPTFGFPVYNPTGPAPSIAHTEPAQEDFF